MGTKKLFFKSKNFSIKWEKYFDVYDICFQKYKNKKVTFVEVGVFNGGSLEVWKKYFHPESRIIGIDINPECKKLEKEGFEIYIGNQADENFWDEFYKKVGKIDILLDDGGHTNIQQITTTLKSIPNINDNGILMIEDTHTSYLREFGNPNKYDFINFTKKKIDDLNFKCPNLGSFKVSLNNYIYSIQYFESIVIFHINTKKTFLNKPIYNKSDNKILNTEQISLQSKTLKYNFMNKCYSFITSLKIKKDKIIKNKKDMTLCKKFFH